MNMLFALSTFKLFNMVFNPSHSQLHWFTLCPCRVHCNHIWLTWCLVPYEVGLVPVANNYPSNNLHCPVLQWCLNLWSIHYCFSTAFPTDNVSVIPWSYWWIDERYNLLNKWLFFLRKNTVSKIFSLSFPEVYRQYLLPEIL